MEYKDYYKILGVERSATTEQIKKAYRRLARKYHPDVTKIKGADDKFKEMGEAYEVLKTPEKRTAYDELGSPSPGQNFRPPPGWEQQFNQGRANGSSADFSDLFSELFGARSGRPGARARTPQPGQDYEATVHISLDDAATGTEVGFDITVPEYTDQGAVRRVPKNITVRIPKGVTDGQKMRVPGRGGPGIEGAPNGDLYINIMLHAHDLFRADGHDLYLELPVTPWEAALGASIEVPTLSGNARLKIRAGARAGQKLRMTGKGLPKPDGSAGDFYAVLQIVSPSVLSTEEKALFEQLEKVSSFNPRGHFGTPE